MTHRSKATRVYVESIYILMLILSVFSCRNEKSNLDGLKPNRGVKTDSIAVSSTGENTFGNIEQPKNTIFRNLEVDTTQLFGTWTQDPTAPFADFYITAKSFNVVGAQQEGDMPYILDKNEFIVFHLGERHQGIIKSTENDTLIIKWANNSFETEYVKQ